MTAAEAVIPEATPKVSPVPVLIWPTFRTLEQESATIVDFPGVYPVLEVLAETQRAFKAFGVAAPQIGINLRAAVVAVNELSGAIINPWWRAIGDETELAPEGCLSIPGEFPQVRRPARIQAGWFDEDGCEVRSELSGIVARVFMHETDHLEGMVIASRIGGLRRQMLAAKMRKLVKTQARAQGKFGPPGMWLPNEGGR